MMKLSILTPAYNAGNTLAASVQAVASLKIDGELEVIVVDDGSSDNTASIAGELGAAYPWVKFIRRENRGESAALNTALDNISWEPDFIAIIEADVEVRPDWLELLLPAFDDPKVMGAGGFLETAPSDPWIARLAGYEIEGKFKSKEKETVHLTSANVLYRAEAFRIAGRFEEKLVNASLDALFNSKLLDEGYKLIYVPDAKVIHHYKTSFFDYLKRQYAYARYRAHLTRTNLYPADRWVGAGVFLAALFWLSILLAWKWPLLPVGLFILMIVVNTIPTVKLFMEKKDPALILNPLVITLRNMVVAVGIPLGMVMKKLGRY